MKNTNLLKFFCLFSLLCLSLPAFAQTTVRGVVTDEGGNPISGVNVIVEGTSRGVVTDGAGNYSIQAAADATLQFSFIGYETQSVFVNNRTGIDVTLAEDALRVDDVVVVGYGTMRRSDLTGSVASVDSEQINKTVATSIDQVLQGRAAGVMIQANSGLPGASTSTRIRGISSLNGSNEPIYVVDGVVISGQSGSDTDNPISSINPADIESVEILKDASATAIYGSQGANGVIIITTKRGNTGDAQVSYNGYVGFQQISKKMDMLNLREYAYQMNARAEALGYPYNESFLDPSILGKGTDWQDELFRNAMMHSHNVSISGGSDRITYSLGVGYLDQDGIALGSSFDRLNLRGNIDVQAKSWLKVGTTFNVSRTRQEISVTDDNAVRIALLQTPNVAARNPDGSYGGPETDEFVQSNPVGLALLKDNRNQKTGFRSSVYAEATLIKGLTLRTEFSSDVNNTSTYRFTPTYTFGAIVNEVTESRRTKDYGQYWSWRNILNYTNTFDRHHINAMLGQEAQRNDYEYLYGFRNGFNSNNTNDLNAGDETSSVANGYHESYALMSYFGRVFYSFDDRYLITATLRADGSSKFTKDNRWGWFPSAAAAWRISGEEFLRYSATVDNLKLRFGWGAVGNQNIPNYKYTDTMVGTTTNWGTGQLVQNIGNKDLKWETTYSTNLGLDLALFNSRVELVVDLYNKKTKNLLLEQSLPAFAGTSGNGSANSPYVNIGSIRNRGVEITLNTRNIENRDFSWSSNIVFSLNRNKVLKLNTDTAVLDMTYQQGSEVSIITRTAVGQPIGQFYGYKVLGRANSSEDFYYTDENGVTQQVAIPEGQSIGKNGVWVGDLLFWDKNGDGVIDEEDRDFIGNPEPKFTFGFGNNFSYKNFDFSLFLSGSVGGKAYNYLRRFIDDARQSHNQTKDATKFAVLNSDSDVLSEVWVTGGAKDMPRISPSDANNNFRVSDRFVEDASYLRIQNISVGYNFPKAWAQKVKVENIKLYVNLQNVWTITGYKGYDPEIGALYQNVLYTGLDNGRYPSPRIYTLGVNITF